MSPVYTVSRIPSVSSISIASWPFCVQLACIWSTARPLYAECNAFCMNVCVDDGIPSTLIVRLLPALLKGVRTLLYFVHAFL